MVVVGAKAWTVIKLSNLLPHDEVAVDVEGGLLSGTTELVLLPKELVSSEDGKNREDEDDEEEDAEEAWNGSEKRLNLLPHRRHLVDGSERAQNTEGSEGLERL